MEDNITVASMKAKFEANEILGFKGKSKKKYIFFISQHAGLCYYKGASKRRGFALTTAELNDFDTYLWQDKEADNKATFKLIDKYRKMALLNPFANDFIDKCLQLPDTYERWKKDGKKSLYDYGVAMGTSIDGKVITFDAIRKQYPRLVDTFFEHYNSDKKYVSGKHPFRGYELSLHVQVYDDGTVKGYLDLEYKSTANGYYYIMINNDAFIGYDID